MEYKNDKVYSGVYGGIPVTFTLHGFTPEVAETFNRELAEAGRRAYEEGRLSAESQRPAVD